MTSKSSGNNDPLDFGDYFSFSHTYNAAAKSPEKKENKGDQKISPSLSSGKSLQNINLLGDDIFDAILKDAEKLQPEDATQQQTVNRCDPVAYSTFGRFSTSVSESVQNASSTSTPSSHAPKDTTAKVTNLNDGERDSGSAVEAKPSGKHQSSLGNDSSSTQRMGSTNGSPRSVSRQTSGMVSPMVNKGTAQTDSFVPDEAAMLEAQLYLEKAEENINIRNWPTRDTTKSENDGRQSIVIKSRGTEEETKVSSDPLISGLFSINNPRDATAGIVSGVKSVSKGVALGVASLVVCPVVGGHQGGVGGFLKGVGAGVLGAVTLPATGVGVAGYQIGRGVINTPNALCQMAHGKKWDKKKGKWTDDWYSLEEESKEVCNAVKRRAEAVANEVDITSQSQGTKGNKVAVADPDFYNILGVSTSATQEEIKRQYYKLAKQYHPDKTKDAKSTEKFTKLGAAYQVLGDEDRRRLYDQHGKAACDEMPILDSSLLFTMLFGSEELEPYVGKLRMALYMELELDHRGRATTEADLEIAQWEREVKVALNLKDIVRPYVCGDLEKWYAGLVEAAKKLCTNTFSTEIVHTIGWTYSNIANRYIGKWDTFLGIGGKVAKFQEQSKSFGKSIKTFTSMVKTAVAERSVQKSNAAGDSAGMVNEEYVKNICETSLPTIMDAMLNICLMDIQSTVKKAARRIVKDMGVDKQWRRKRAEALGLMGRAFMVAAEDAKRRLQEESKPTNIYDMFAQAAGKAKNRQQNPQASYTYREDDGFY